MQAPQALPYSIELFDYIVHQLPNCIELFQLGSLEFHELKQLIKDDVAIKQVGRSGHTKELYFLQLASLTGLLFFGGFNSEGILHFSVIKSNPYVKWSPILNSHFELGQYSRSFEQYIQSYQTLVFAKQFHTDTLKISILEPISTLLLEHQNKISDCIAMYEKVIHSQNLIQTIITNPELMFITLSAMPTESLNTFYTRLHHVFETDDLLLSPDKEKSIPIKRLFETQSHDSYTLIYKIQVHFNILLHSDYAPEKMRIETEKILRQLFQETALQQKTIETLRYTLDNQLYSRHKLYGLFLSPLKQIYHIQ